MAKALMVEASPTRTHRCRCESGQYAAVVQPSSRHLTKATALAAFALALLGACAGSTKPGSHDPAPDRRLRVQDLPSGYRLADRQRAQDVRFYLCAAPTLRPRARVQRNYYKSRVGPYVTSSVLTFASGDAAKYLAAVAANTKCRTFTDPAGCAAEITRVDGDVAQNRMVLRLVTKCSTSSLQAAFIVLRHGDRIAEVAYDPDAQEPIEDAVVTQLADNAASRLRT
ncbi:MAG: hypothetical protein QOK28_2706 [Actinomycetota bacterium]|jgi:hypothetical protein